MKLVVKENVNTVAEPVKKVWTAVINSVDGYGKIPYSIGQAKGDIIVFDSAGHAVRFANSTSDGQVLGTDSTTTTGLAWVTAGGGGAGAKLTNGTGGAVTAGTIVYIDSSTGTFKKAGSKTVAERLFIVSKDCADAEDVDCYSVDGTAVNVLCDSGAVAIGDGISVSSTMTGYGTADDYGTIGEALSTKASGATGNVKCVLRQKINRLMLCKNVGSSDISKGTVLKMIPTTESTAEVEARSGASTADGIAVQAITVNSTGLMSAHNNDVVDVLCTTDEVQKGDWLVRSSTAGYAKMGNGYGIGKALESKASGSTGLVSCYLNLGGYGVTNRASWFLVDGISSADVIAAYQFIGADSEALSLYDLLGNDDYTLTKYGTTTWNKDTGMLFTGVGAYLGNSTLASMASQINAGCFSYDATLKTGSVTSIGGLRIYDSVSVYHTLLVSIYSSSTNVPMYNKHVSGNNRFYSTMSSWTTGTPISGVFGANFDSTAVVYREGVEYTNSSSASTPVITYSADTDMIIGNVRYGSYTPIPLYVKAFALYNTELTAAQYAELYSNMNALG